jgi:hypothetical protein
MKTPCDVDKIFVLPGYYTELSGNALPKNILGFLDP